MSHENIIINTFDHQFTLGELQEDVRAARHKFERHEFSFTAQTVQALIWKIEELHNKLNPL